jgi:hypothetical protein
MAISFLAQSTLVQRIKGRKVINVFAHTNPRGFILQMNDKIVYNCI